MRFISTPLLAALAIVFSAGAQAQAPSTDAASTPSIPLETIPGTSAGAPQVEPAQSRGEILAAKQFGWLDTNHDGFLSRDEVALFPRLRDAFDQADADHDNRVSFDEIRALALQKRAEKDQAAAAASTPGGEPPSSLPKRAAVPPKAW